MPPLRAQDARSVTLTGSSFSRSYGGILPSSLTTVLPIALVFSTCPPVLVSGTGAVPTHCRAFLGSMGSVTSPVAARHRVSELTAPTVHRNPPTRLPQDNHRLGSPTLLRPPSVTRHRLVGSFSPRKVSHPLSTRLWAWRGHGGTGISTSCASTTPFGLALAPDSPRAD